jgi:hypothetical protein
MNNEEAKFILGAYRAGGQDDRDPQFQAALEQARRDPELGRWFARELAIDSQIATKLKAGLRPPPDLKARLLAQQKIVPIIPWWRQRAWLATGLAACLALLLGVGVLWIGPREPSELAQYRQTMAELVTGKLDHVDLMSHDLMEVRRWLAHQSTDASFVVPSGLKGKPSIGCRLLDWRGQKVSLICFQLTNHQVAHLLVIDRKSFGQELSSTPRLAKVGDVNTAAWSRDGKTYLVVSKGGRKRDLLKLL